MVVALMVPAMAHAEFFSGNDLHRKITSTDVIDRAQALGYVQGVFDMTQGWGHCAPNNAGVTGGQIQDMVAQSLVANPATRNLSADVLVLNVLKVRWPCANQNKGRGA
jgi:hypothetical protein